MKISLNDKMGLSHTIDITDKNARAYEKLNNMPIDADAVIIYLMANQCCKKSEDVDYSRTDEKLSQTVNEEIENEIRDCGGDTFTEDKTYLEYDLPKSLQTALDQLKSDLSKTVSFGLDMDYDELNACINSAEVCQEITEEQSWYLREKYLGLQKC